MSGSVLNIVIKLTAVLLAILLWFNVVTQKQYEYELMLPITSVDIPGGLALVTPPPDSLRVSVLSEGKKLLKDDWKKAGLRLKGNRLKRGGNLLEVTHETVALVRSEDISVVGFPGSQPIALQLDRIDSLYKPVASRLAPICESGYMILANDESIEPAQVRIVGPASVIRDIDSIYTESKIVDDIDKSGSYSLQLESTTRVPVTLREDSATVSIVVDKIVSRRFASVPLDYNRFQRGKQVIVEPERVTLVIDGPESLMDALQASQFEVKVALPEDSTIGYVRPIVVLPPNFTLESMEPDSVRVAISK